MSTAAAGAFPRKVTGRRGNLRRGRGARTISYNSTDLRLGNIYVYIWRGRGVSRAWSGVGEAWIPVLIPLLPSTPSLVVSIFFLHCLS